MARSLESKRSEKNSKYHKYRGGRPSWILGDGHFELKFRENSNMSTPWLVIYQNAAFDEHI
jgi:hypothetical protein